MNWVQTSSYRCRVRVALMAGILVILTASNSCLGQALPPSTSIPVQFTHTIQAGKVLSGTVVKAKTMQVVVLPGGRMLPKGALVLGHITASRQFTFNPAPYAIQQPSYIAIHFDRVVTKHMNVHLNVAVRALVDNLDAYDAVYPHRLDETDSLGTMELIGGGYYSPIGKRVFDFDEDIIGYVREHGVYGQLISNEYTSHNASFHCDGTETEQALAIFSPDACGLYGFYQIYLPENGSKPGRPFVLASRHFTVKLYSGSAALLEVNHSP